MDNMDDIEDLINDTEGLTVQDAVMERHEKIVVAMRQLDEDFYPKSGEDFKLKAVLDNLRIIHKASDEMIRIFTATAIELSSEDEDDKEPA